MCVANLDRMMIGPALSTRLPFEDDNATVLGSALDAGGARPTCSPASKPMAVLSSARRR